MNEVVPSSYMVLYSLLAWPKGPFTFMNEMGMAEAGKRVKLVVDAGYLHLPKKFASGDMSPWDL